MVQRWTFWVVTCCPLPSVSYTHLDVYKRQELAGVLPQLADGTSLSLEPEQLVLTGSTEHGNLVFTPTADAQGRITWGCANGEGLKPTQLPPSCRKPVSGNENQ